MIADKIIKSFYLLEAEGKAVDILVSDEFNVKKVSLSSLSFPNEFEAGAALSTALEFLVSSPSINAAKGKSSVVYNPEFFPSITTEPEFTEEEQEAIQAAEVRHQEILEMLEAQGKTAVLITNKFDPIGDFVSTRMVLEGDDFKIKGRVAANPDDYLALKGQEYEYQHSDVLTKRRDFVVH